MAVGKLVEKNLKELEKVYTLLHSMVCTLLPSCTQMYTVISTHTVYAVYVVVLHVLYEQSGAVCPTSTPEWPRERQ